MGIYLHTDVETTDDGDFIIDDLGDLKVASPMRTVAQAINNIILTNKGELLTDTSFGANLQQFYGDRNTEYTRHMMERNILSEVSNQGLIDRSDFSVDVVAVDISEAGIIATINGVFIDTSTGNLGGVIKVDNGIDMGYLYPFISGVITPVDPVDALNPSNF